MSQSATLAFYVLIEIVAVLILFAAQKKEDEYNRIVMDNDIEYNERTIIKISTIFIFLSFAILFLVAALRDHVGTDYDRYVYYFNKIQINDLNNADIRYLSQSISFWAICKILGLLGLSYYWMFAVLSLITLYFMYKSIISLSFNWGLSLFIIIAFCLYFQSFNQIRQMAAVSIVMFSIKQLKHNKKLKFLFFVLLAASFHLGALIFLIIVPLKNKKINIGVLLAYIIIAILFYAGFYRIMGMFSFLSYVQVYGNSSLFGAAGLSSSIINTVVRFVMITFCLFFYKETIRKNPEYNALYHMGLICAVLQLGAVRFNIFGRITTYFYIGYIFLLPAVLDTIKKSIRGYGYLVINVCTYAFLFVYQFIYYFSSSGAIGSGYLRYYSIF